MENDNRVIYIDLLRGISILAVINIHIAASPIISNVYSTGLYDWWIHNIYDSISRWAVPVFVMISGSLLINPKKEETIRHFLKKRIKKVMIPFIFWSVVYIMYTSRNNFGELSFINIIKKFLEGNIYWHMWFVYMIMGLYAITPIISQYIKNATDTNIVYLLTILFISTSFIDIIEKIFKIQVNSFLVLRPVGGFIAYYILGYFLSKNNNLTCKFKKIIYLGAILSLIIIPVGTFLLSKNNNGVLDMYFYDYTNPFVILIATSIFMIFKNNNWEDFFKNKKILLKNIIIISNLSFGIYLIHPLIMDLVFRINIIKCIEKLNPLISIPVFDLIIFCISLSIISILKKIPYIKQ